MLESNPGTSMRTLFTPTASTPDTCAQRIPSRKIAFSILFVHLIGLGIACAGPGKRNSMYTRVDDVTVRIGIGPRYLWGEADRPPEGHAERYGRLRDLFDIAGCPMVEPARNTTDVANADLLICRLQGQTETIIVVVSDFEGPAWLKRDGWPAAAMLPGLYSALSVEDRRHSFVFIASDEIRSLRGRTRENAGLGIPGTENSNDIAAVVNIRAMGSRVFGVVSDRADLDLYQDLIRVGRSLNIPVKLIRAPNRDKYPMEDSTVLTRADGSMMPAISLVISDFGMSDYLDSFRTLAVYLAYVDHTRSHDTPSQSQASQLRGLPAPPE